MDESKKPVPTGHVIEGGVVADAAPATAGNRPGLLVEDETLVGGRDAATGAPVVAPKTTDGRADESVVPTDKNES